MLVKHNDTIYRLPTHAHKLPNKEAFEKFKARNKKCEVLVFELTGGYTVVILDNLEFVDAADDHLHS